MATNRLAAVFLVAGLILPSEALAATNIQPGSSSAQPSIKKPRISKRLLLQVVRDFRDRVGRDEGLYYLVNPPGGATEEERSEVENEIVHFLSRIHKDPTLDFPSKWIKDLREYDLTPAEWDRIDALFNEALAASSLPPGSRHILSDRFSRLRAEILTS